MSVESDIEKIKSEMISHNREDDIRFKNLDDKADQTHNMIVDLTEKLEPVISWFSNVSWGKKTLMGFLKVISIIVGIILATISILKVIISQLR